MNPLCSRVSQAGLKLILGSQSPRRRQLLESAGFDFEVVKPAEMAEQNVPEHLSPAELVVELAYRKAADVAGRVDGALVIGCDTVAECDGRILGKPADEEDARRMLGKLSGRRHRVLSGLCLWPVGGAGSVAGNGPVQRIEVTSLDMDHLSDTQLEEYLASGQWRGKAGSFGYQDELGWVHVVEGSESNVVGLPMELLESMILEMFPGG
ncbi:MAG: septum formation protein Maf [Pirellulales bacterium]|nr:septum formation protein Maf [Pirellulales bacterium]